jgi:hypothetical protein
MKVLALGLIPLAVACGPRDQPQDSKTNAVSTKAIVTSGVVTKDSVALATYEDSILGQLSFGHPRTVTPNGDTLESLGSGFLQDPAAKDYGFRYYSRNGVRYLRIARMSGRSARGMLIWSTRSRLRLPPMDSTEHLVLEGYCLINGKDAPLVVAITGTAGDSVYWQARHAWSLDTTAGTLRDIPTTGVTCSHVSGEE